MKKDSPANKTCFKCLLLKPADEFYRHPMMADGRLGKCKECNKIDVRENYAKRRKQYSDYDRERYKDPQRRKAMVEYLRRQRLKNPEKARCRNRTAKAIRTGAIVKSKSCDICCKRRPLQAHHPDYSNHLNVEWLCFTCHREHRHGQKVTVRK